MSRNPDHAMLPRPDAEDLARQRYVLALKGYVGRKLRPGNRAIFDNVAKVRGMDITICTTAEDDAGGRALLEAFGFPFRRTETLN